MREVSEHHRAQISRGLKKLWADPAFRERRKNDSLEWPPARVALLVKLYLENLSAREIANRMADGATRNGVLGKLYRLAKDEEIPPNPRAQKAKSCRQPKSADAAPSPPAEKKTMRDISLASVKPTDRGRPFNPKSVGTLVKMAEPIPFTNGARITIMELTAGTCRWPIGEPGTEDFCFCGHSPRYLSPYCEYHARVAYQPTQDRAGAKHLQLPNFTGLSK